MDLTMTSCGSSFRTNVQQDIEIGIPKISSGPDGFTTISYPITRSIFPDNLVFKIDTEYEDFIDQSLNCALIALILPAMRSGSRIILNGPISERLLYSCQGNLQSVVKLILGYELIPIVHNGGFTINERAKDNFIVTGFSGGIDSYSILEEHHFRSKAPQSGINALVFNNVGANGTTDERDLFENRLHHANKGAKAVGLPLIVVESNMDDFYSLYDDLHFFKTHSFRNSSVAHLLSKTVSTYLYAASRAYSEVRVEPSDTIGCVDPITLPLLGSENLKLQSEGGRYSRSEKIASVVDFNVVQNNLYVCVDHHAFGNCSVCQKCVRTLLIIDCLGYLERFSNVFDLNKYLYIKEDRLVRFIAKNDSFSDDLKLYFESSGVKFSASLLLRIKLLMISNDIRKLFKSVLSAMSSK